MCNEDIIYKAAVSSGLFTKEAANAIIASGRRLPLHTYQEWKRMGYQVKQGQHAVLVVDLWRFAKNKPADDSQSTEELGEHAYKTKAHLFASPQVEKAVTRTVKTRDELIAYNKMLAEQRRARKNA